MTLNETLPFTTRLLLLITEISSGRDVFGMERKRIIHRSTNDWTDEVFLQKILTKLSLYGVKYKNSTKELQERPITPGVENVSDHGTIGLTKFWGSLKIFTSIKFFYVKQILVKNNCT